MTILSTPLLSTEPMVAGSSSRIRIRTQRRAATASALQAQCRINTPLGPLTLASTAHGLALVVFDGQTHHPGMLAAPVAPGHPHLQHAARQFDAYFSHGLLRFDVPLDPQGTPFQQAVWQALMQIDSGRLSTYGAVALQIGQPRAVRAVAAAIGRNPVCIIVPCHRVIGRDGSLTGYAGGLPRKAALLKLEHAAPGS